jgi:hypothetical protein
MVAGTTSRAERQRRVADGNLFFNRSGMTISQTAEIIAEILHGVSFGEKTEGVHWCRSEASVARDLIRMGASRT